MSPRFTLHEAGTSPDWDGDTKVCLFKYCQKRHCFLLVPSHTGIRGNENLTHSYILKKDPPPLCEHCQCNLTVRHILVECNHFAQERKDIFGRRDEVESFRFQPTLIVLFLKQIEFYYKF